ncbi:MAG: oligosaccharide flippase family protein [Acidipropionibacterium sp.]|nr:oligosaccharide flippase family protein [Acidipropionibacterium sp.]
MLTALIIVPLVTHLRGADGYGLYALTTSLALLFQQDLGMGPSAVRSIAIAVERSDHTRLRQIVASTRLFYLASSTLFSIVIGVGFLLLWPTYHIPAALHQDSVVLACTSILTVAFTLSFSAYRQILVGLGKLDLVNGIQSIQNILRIILSVALLSLTHVGVMAVGIIDAACAFAAGLALVALVQHSLQMRWVHLQEGRWETFVEVFRLSAELMIMNISAVMIMQMGSVIASALLPLGAVAVYGASQRILQGTKEITASLSSSVLPSAARSEARGADEKLRSIYTDGTRYANSLMLIVTIPLVVLMPQVVDIWLGGSLDIRAVAVTAQVLVVSVWVNNNHLLAIPILTAKAKIRRFVILHAIWALSGTGLAVVFGLRWGTPGIAAGITFPVVVLESFYINWTVTVLKMRWQEFVLTSILRPFSVLFTIGIVVFVPIKLLMSDDYHLGHTIGVILGWLIVASVGVWRFVLKENERARFMSRIRARFFPGKAGMRRD